MNRADLAILLQEGEGTMLEYKESLPTSFARDLTGLANTLGGKILLGVRDDGSVAGITDSNDLRARIQDFARNCDPPVRVLVEPVGNVVVVIVRESDAKPVQCREGFFWRQGAGTQKLSRDEIRDFFRSEGVIRFDLSLCPKFRYPQDFDRKKFDAWIEGSGISASGRVDDILVNIEVAERSAGKLLFRNAGVLFFAKKVRHFFNQAYITCLLAKGTDKVHVLDRKDFDGGIVADIEDAMRFIERNTRTAWRIEALRREDIPEYPMKALREAITNAVMHRDWFMEGANVFVELYGPHRGQQPRRPAQGDDAFRSRPQEHSSQRPHRRHASPHRVHRESRHRHQAHPGRRARSRLPGAAVRGNRLRHRHLLSEPGGAGPSRERIGITYPASTRQVPDKYPSS